MEILPLFREAVSHHASDLHLCAHVPPILRIDGVLRALNTPPLASEELHEMIMGVLNETQRAKFEETWELDFSLELPAIGRFRANVHRQRGNTEAAFRVIYEEIRSVRQLGLPPIVEEFCRYPNGLILITGPTGSGKTTTLAAMLDLINATRSCMIVTIEDPIEFLHRNKRSIIKQREVRCDTKSFSEALLRVLRQDPDVIAVGEMRDLETISTALTAAETGHLVLATLHTPDVVQTVDRIIDVFPPHQQSQIRIQLASSLQAIVGQQLLGIPGEKGRVVASEILLATPAARQVIRAGKTEQLMTIIQTSSEMGMISMDKSLKNLYQKGLVSYDDAISKCKFPGQFEQL
ncbi:MAG TPA: type IV pilus twitching motility protein PilT [Candidatus Sumerlaeota bacterium]|nr:type IV pilus twitching motility protein PilT [Candidatus Sumerlaeota bacterium]